MSFLEEWDFDTVLPSPLVERIRVFDSQISIFASKTRSQGLTSHVSSPLAESGTVSEKWKTISRIATKLPFKAPKQVKHGTMMNTYLHVYTLLQQTEPSLEGTSQAATTSRQEHALIEALTKIGTKVISEDTPWPWRTGHGAVGSIEVEFLSCHTALCCPVKKQFVDSSCFLSWALKCPLLEMKWEHPKWWVQCWLHIQLTTVLSIVLKQYHIKIT